MLLSYDHSGASPLASSARGMSSSSVQPAMESPQAHSADSAARKRPQQADESKPAGARLAKRQRPNGLSAADHAADSEVSDSEAAFQLVGLEGLDLDLFKKEALYRQLLEYRRLLDDAQQRSLALTTELDRLRSAEAALRASWQSLSPAVALAAFPDSAAFSSTQDYASALEAFAAQHGSHHNGDSSDQPDRMARLTAESVANKQALALTQAQLHSVKLQLEHMQDKWARAEKRADRSVSSTVAILEKRALPQPPDPPQSQDPPPPQPASPAQASSSHAMQVDEPSQQPMRSAEAQQLQQAEVTALYEAEERLRLLAAQRQTEIDQLRLALQYPSDEAVRTSPAYAALQFELHSGRADVDTALRQLESVSSELTTFREVQFSWRDALLKDHAGGDEMERRHADRERDLARIRLQREELKAENMELKMRDAEKHKSVEQIRELANSKEDRITAFKSEVRRLRMSLAASKGDSEGVDLEQREWEDQVNTLRDQLQSATDLVFALRDQLKSYSTIAGSASALVESETNIRLELLKAKKRLDHLDSMLAVSPTHRDGDTAGMGKKVIEQDERIKVLEASCKAAEASSTMLITEVDRLSSAWQTLDAQNRDKVLNLIQHEDKVSRLLSEKAKADNRYFAAMRAKEALAAENLVLSKTTEKQNKALASCEEAAKAQAEHAKCIEQEVAKQSERVAECSRKLDAMTTQRDGLVAEKDSTAGQVADLQQRLADKSQETDQLESEKRRLVQQIDQLETRVGKFETAEAASRSGKDKTMQVQELERFNEDLTKMLKCTSCKTRFKSHVITRCFHLLCHECIEARLSHRQRKCPTCQMAFGQADVAQVYF